MYPDVALDWYHKGIVIPEFTWNSSQPRLRALYGSDKDGGSGGEGDVSGLGG